MSINPVRRTGLRLLLPYMRPYRGTLALGTLYAVIGASASAFSPTLLGLAVDELLQGVRPAILALYAAGLIGLAATLALFRYLLRMLTGTIAAGVTYTLSRDLFAHLLLLDRGAIQKFGSGDLLSRATSDFIYIWRFYSAGFQMSMHALFLLSIGCVLMARSSPLLATITIAMLALSVTVQVGLGRVLERSFTRVQAEMGRLSAFAQEHIGAARLVAAYNQEHAVARAFRRLNAAYTNQVLGFTLRSSAISPLPALVVRLAATLVLAVGGVLVLDGVLTLGNYVEFIVYLGLLATAAQQLSQAFERLQQGSAAAVRVDEVLRRLPDVAEPSDPQPLPAGRSIRFEHVGVRADGRWALHNLDLEVPAGATIGIVGATGSGKSTLLSLVGRIRDPDEGRVLLGEVDVRCLRLADLRRVVAYVPQETLLFSMALRENLTLGLDDVSDARIDQAVRRARLSNDLPQLPQHYATVVGERGATLSGGQRQRTAIARALVRDPEILLLDDALSSVDPYTAAEILAELRQARAGRTCMIVAQRLASVRDADRIVVIAAGRVAEQGTHAELLALDGLYAQMERREREQAEAISEVAE